MKKSPRLAVAFGTSWLSATNAHVWANPYVRKDGTGTFAQKGLCFASSFFKGSFKTV
jgi:hypothetical protein